VSRPVGAPVGTAHITGPPRVTLTKPEAAAALGISIDSFERHVQPELRVIRRGRMRLVPCAELERWATENTAFALEDRSR
jgi:hypothetical protein